MILRIFICLLCGTERGYGVSKDLDFQPLINCSWCKKATRHKNSGRDKPIENVRIDIARIKTGLRLI